MTTPWTRAGMLLYRHLPEELRYRDNPTSEELGDLAAYLNGCGDFLDLMRATIAQSYADNFAEPTDDGLAAQPWILPYTAQLLGVTLLAPELDGSGNIRRRELANAVGWSKGKGTLRIADATSDLLAGVETVLVEGWRRTLTTPRLALPPYSVAPGRAGPDTTPLGTPDFRTMNRAITDPAGIDPIRTFTLTGRDPAGFTTSETVFWRHKARRGAACFPGAYDDTTATTPDLRTAALHRLGPAPGRVTIHVQPPKGFFDGPLRQVALTTAALNDFLDINPGAEIGPEDVFTIMGLQGPAPDRIRLTAPLTIEAGRTVTLRNLNFHGAGIVTPLTVATGGSCTLESVAVERTRVEAPADPETPSLVARNTIIGELIGAAGFALLEYVTVMGDTTLGRLHASDCIFVGAIIDAVCLEQNSCIRFSRVPPALLSAVDPNDANRPLCAFAEARSNTTAPPRFAKRPFRDTVGEPCVVREPVFGEPGAGVLDAQTSDVITAGAEDGTEMGAYHGLAYAARLAALTAKLGDQLPLGQSLTLIHDPLLTQRPLALIGGG